METLPSLMIALASIAVGVTVAVHHRLIGVLLVLHGASAALVLPSWYATGGQADLVADQLLAGAWVLLFIWVAVIGYLVPDGRFTSRFWSRWVRVGCVGAALFVLGAIGSDPEGFRASHGGVDPPVDWLPAPLSAGLSLIGLVLVLLLLFGSVIAVVQRLRRARGDVRLQLLWLVLGVVPVPVTLMTGWTFHFALGSDGGAAFTILLTLTGVALPLAIGVAVLRHRLFDIEWVLSRTVTFMTLVTGTAVLYGALLVGADRLLGYEGLSGVLVLAVVAVVSSPAYVRIRGRIERWVYGYRAEPHLAMRLLAEKAEAANGDGLVAAVTEVVAAVVKADRVWIGEPGTGEPMIWRGQELGDLVVQMPAGADMAPRDRTLLRDLARHTAILVRAERLHADLRASRRRIVEGREEERRRLRRDLHDGVGPSLASVLLLLSAARSGKNDAERDGLVDEAIGEVRSTIGEIRRVVENLRPTAIDQVGLVDAIRQRAQSLNGDTRVEVCSVARIPELPAAVEVAAYRIACEAMTNSLRHSGASQCLVEIGVGEGLEITVSDDGVGPGAAARPGVGWTSMQERAAELGGWCAIDCAGPRGGVRVKAVLPLLAELEVVHS